MGDTSSKEKGDGRAGGWVLYYYTNYDIAVKRWPTRFNSPEEGERLLREMNPLTLADSPKMIYSDRYVWESE